MAQFEGYERREAKDSADVLKEYGISSIDECKDIILQNGRRRRSRSCSETQPICFENAVVGLHRGRGDRHQKAERTDDKAAGCRCRGHRYRSAELLYSRLRCAKTARWASATATSAKCSFPRRPSASASSRDTNPSRRRRALLKSR